MVRWIEPYKIKKIKQNKTCTLSKLSLPSFSMKIEGRIVKQLTTGIRQSQVTNPAYPLCLDVIANTLVGNRALHKPYGRDKNE